MLFKVSVAAQLPGRQAEAWPECREGQLNPRDQNTWPQSTAACPGPCSIPVARATSHTGAGTGAIAAVPASGSPEPASLCSPGEAGARRAAARMLHHEETPAPAPSRPGSQLANWLCILAGVS